MHCNRTCEFFLTHFVAFASLSAVLSFLAPPATAQIPSLREPWPVVFHARMRQLKAVEYRLKQATGGLCPENSAQTGLVFDYIAAYPERDRKAIGEILGLTDLPQVVGVAPASPAFAAGIRAGDEVVGINGQSSRDLIEASREPGLFAEELLDLVAATPKGQDVRLSLRRDEVLVDIAISPEWLCAPRFILKIGEGIDAYTDGENIAIGEALLGFARNDDELALIAGHELAHVIYRDGKTASRAERRFMEDRADLLGVALARCGGFDAGKGLDYWRRREKRDARHRFRFSAYRAAAARVAAMEAGLRKPAACPPDPRRIEELARSIHA